MSFSENRLWTYWVSVLCLALLATTTALATEPMIGGKAMSPSKDIIDNSLNSADHTTLVAAVKAAGLVHTLKGAGPFTVFAPTNDAFENLPTGTVDGLLQPEARNRLTKILTYHVISGRFTAEDIAKAIQQGGGKVELKTVAGGKLTATLNGPKNVVVKDGSGDIANVVTYDVLQSNGVIHVIDRVLLPDGEPADAPPARRSSTPSGELGKSESLTGTISRSPAVLINPVHSSETASDPRQPVPARGNQIPRLARGQVAYVPLPAELEKRTNDYVLEVLPSHPRISTNSVTVFRGAVRMGLDGGEELVLKSVAWATPLRYSPEREIFEGVLSLGVVEVGRRTDGRLPSPITFQIIGPVLSKPELTIVETAAPPYQEVRISSQSPVLPMELNVVSNVLPEGEKLPLRVDPALFVSVTPAEIQGWGLETATISVRARGADQSTNRAIQLGSDFGYVNPVETELGTNDTGQSFIRSASHGKATVYAVGPAFDAVDIQIDFRFPFRFIVAGVAGGLAGGVVRAFSTGRRRPRVTQLTVAMICGFIVFVLYCLGVNIIGVPLPQNAGEPLVLVVSTFGAMGGPRLLERALRLPAAK
jgi:uncharacterized surface protein with fasciclin (FAS1) repeats